ncbi:MAG TPA: hypothetical protein VE153_10495 [Myxococcus sp.]|nr:hypothetical protein [Myxococcus sp.]
MMRSSPSPLLVLALLLSTGSFAQAPDGEQRVMEGNGASLASEDRLGAVVAPVTLPDGSTSLYGFMGAPELGVGFRQGISGFELEARGWL